MKVLSSLVSPVTNTWMKGRKEACRRVKAFALTLQYPLRDLLLGERRVFVEEGRHEGQVQLGVARGDICGGDKLPATQPVGLLQQTLCSLFKILLLMTQTQTALTALNSN